MIKVYLDTCAIQRPLDTLDQTRLRMEAEAILGVLAQIAAGKLELISSSILKVEITRNPLAVRREHGEQVLALASATVFVNSGIAGRADDFVQRGIKSMDALHLASAEASGADYFCTCDDRFLRRARNIAKLRIEVVSPLELAERIEL